MLDFTDEEYMRESSLEYYAEKVGLTNKTFSILFKEINGICFRKFRNVILDRKIKEYLEKYKYNKNIVLMHLPISINYLNKRIRNMVKSGQLGKELNIRKQYTYHRIIKTKTELLKLKAEHAKIKAEINKIYDSGVYHGQELNRLISIEEKILRNTI